MMHILTIFTIFLLVIQQTFAVNCICKCCTSTGCRPEAEAGRRDLWYCSSSSCTRERCAEWFYDKCPRKDAIGDVLSECRSNGNKSLPSLFIITGITSIIIMIKNKF